ncbi:phosphate acetyltransferase [Mycoplasmoides pneumoniae]|uniref:Phosphate acetyltransferase n=1 Tax=Mycoplasmoides pneumoniae 309 TaxID=1112856 RepID=A0AB33HLU4_MYCPM|nr:phosphate acetyltransferase [Mycoplasmoides pneumoniae]BAL22006.1 phosphotransacetylase/ phosphate acetyltransferase [Mycoplasmoides pneumoniae 309]
MSVIDLLKQRVQSAGKKPVIIFPEGWSPTVMEAVNQLQQAGILTPAVIFRNRSEVPAGFNTAIKHYVIEEMDLTKYANFVYEKRKHKGMEMREAQKFVRDASSLAATLVALNEVDGEVCGKEYATKDTLRPALQLLGTGNFVSSVFIMEKNEERLYFTDCAFAVYPSPQELAVVAENTFKFAQSMGEPELKMVFLSYSTLGSGKGEAVDKVVSATQIFLEKHPELKANVCGELQFDSAFVEKVRKQKAPNLTWNGSANIYVFPNLDAGNIGYKIAQRLGGYEAIGPIVLGLARPFNDLSRGASVSDVFNVGIITAAQTLK